MSPNPNIWVKTYSLSTNPSTFNRGAYAIRQAADGGYLVAGSIDADNGMAWVLKLDDVGNVNWEKEYHAKPPDTSWPYPHEIELTSPDGGYIVAGNITVAGHGTDAWLLKLDKDGNRVWEKSYGGDGAFDAFGVKQTKDGGYIVAGSRTLSFFKTGTDIWIVKLDKLGDIVWQKEYRSPDHKVSYRQANSIQQTDDGGFIVAGDIFLVTGSPAASTISFDDLFALRLGKDGGVVWAREFGGNQPDWATSVVRTKDGDYVLVGGTMSYGAGSSDIWVLKLKSDGSPRWQKTLGCTGYDNAYDAQSLGDAVAVLGNTQSPTTGTDIWLLKLDLHGAVIWDRVYGGSGEDAARSVWLTKDDGFALTGQTTSWGSGGSDTLVLRLDSNGKTRLPPPTK